MNVNFKKLSLLVVFAMLLSACAPQAAATQPPAATQAPPSEAPPTQAPPTEAPTPTPLPPGSQVDVREDAALGTFLVDEKGMTLYLFTKDTPHTSSCYDSCAEKWPPLLTEGAPQAGTGVDAAMLGTTERKDGTQQVTYNSWPLYYWWEDKAAGDALGQDVGGVWYVVSPAGESIKTVAAAPVPPASDPLPATGGEVEVEVEDHDTLGPMLVDSDGMTLYLYTKDTPNTSVCYDQCAENWPPLLASGELKAKEGVDAALLGTTQRTDGTLQVTYNSWPLYYYIKDIKAGDVLGQEVGSVWFVVSPAGEMIEGAP